LFIGATFVAMENHRTDSIPNDSYPVKSDRLLGIEKPSSPVRLDGLSRNPPRGREPAGTALGNEAD